MCTNCNENFLNKEIDMVRAKLKACQSGHLEFYLKYLRVLEDKKREELFKVIKGGRYGKD